SLRSRPPRGQVPHASAHAVRPARPPSAVAHGDLHDQRTPIEPKGDGAAEQEDDLDAEPAAEIDAPSARVDFDAAHPGAATREPGQRRGSCSTEFVCEEKADGSRVDTQGVRAGTNGGAIGRYAARAFSALRPGAYPILRSGPRRVSGLALLDVAQFD